MNVLDLFSGIGGFSLGLERAGMRTVAFCEIDPYCRRVLRRHWPHVPIHHDVRELKGSAVGPIDVICGGFPCTDISVAGKGLGITGPQSGLWSEYARIIGELRPRYVIVENVAALLGRGLERVLGDLAALGFDAEWHCIPASAVGAPHRRDRVWIIAYPQHPDADSAGSYRTPQHVNGNAEFRDQQVGVAGSLCEDVADAGSARLSSSECQTLFGAGRWEEGRATSECGEIPNPDSQPPRRLTISWGECGHWLVEPNVGRVAHGVPARVDRLRSLGNSVVPQIPEIIGRAIMMNHKEDQ